MFSNNLKAHILQSAITVLEAEGKIRTEWQRTGTQGGRSALMVEVIDASAAAANSKSLEMPEGADPSGIQQPDADRSTDPPKTTTNPADFDTPG